MRDRYVAEDIGTGQRHSQTKDGRRHKGDEQQPQLKRPAGSDLTQQQHDTGRKKSVHDQEQRLVGGLYAKQINSGSKKQSPVKDAGSSSRSADTE